MIYPKPFAPAAERNKQAILLALQKVLHAHDTVFEFGSGTGQHACHMAAAMPNLTWQPSDLKDKLTGIRQWIAESGCHNIRPPVQLDLDDRLLPAHKASVCFSANTLHIVSWRHVEKLFKFSAAIMSNSDNGMLCVYGPFVFDGQHVSDSNNQFDQQLRHRHPQSGLRDVTALDQLARSNGFTAAKIIDMPANNHLLVWDRGTSDSLYD